MVLIVSDIEGVSSCPVLICLCLVTCSSVFAGVARGRFVVGGYQALRCVSAKLGKNGLGSSRWQALAGSERH